MVSKANSYLFLKSLKWRRKMFNNIFVFVFVLSVPLLGADSSGTLSSYEKELKKEAELLIKIREIPQMATDAINNSRETNKDAKRLQRLITALEKGDNLLQTCLHLKTTIGQLTDEKQLFETKYKRLVSHEKFDRTISGYIDEISKTSKSYDESCKNFKGSLL
jgi:hypothetical protein